MKRLLITGSRDWADEARIGDALFWAWHDLGNAMVDTPITLVHGDCHLGGADKIAEKIWKEQTNGFPVEAHPADWKRYGKDAGPRRNREMVELGADLCLAFPLGESRGTRGCIELARAAGIEVRIFEG